MPRILLPLALLCVTAASAASASSAADAQHQQILVFAAASLTNALQDIGASYERTARVEVKLSFDASSSLARQIEAGAPADVFFSADPDWMDYLQQRKLIQPNSRRNLLGNALVLIAPAQSPVALKIAPHFQLTAALGNGRLATGDPDSVPAGRYARSALMLLGVWDEVAARIAGAENVRAALKYVATGEAPLGIVYRSDALIDRQVRIVDTFPEDSHPPIIYPIALTRSAQTDASALVAYMSGPQAREIFVKYGFTVLAPRASSTGAHNGLQPAAQDAKAYRR